MMLDRIRVDEVAYRAWVGERELNVRGLQFRLLAYLVQHAGRVVHRLDVMRDVWGSEWGSHKSIDMNICGLRRKLGDPRYITTIRGVGFRIDADLVVPVDRPVPRSLHVELGEQGKTLALGNLDLADALSEVRVQLAPDRRPTVTVSLAVTSTWMKIPDAQITLDDQTAALLKHLGWSPPNPPDPRQN